MRIIYPHPMVFPNKLAHSIQIIHTCWELASKGVRVDLLVKKLEKDSIAECLKVYGLIEHKNLCIHGKVDTNTHRKFFYLKVLKKIWRHRKDPDTIVFLRDKKLAKLLMRFRYFFKIPYTFESHAVSYLVRQDKYDREKTQIRLTDWFRSKLKIWKTYRIEKFIYQNASAIICTTFGSEKVIHEKFNISAPTKIIYNATAIAAKNHEYQGKDILYLGQLYPQKGADVLIEALQHLPERKLIIIGGNKEEDLARIRALGERFGVSARVTISGYIEPIEIRNYLDQIGVGVIPILDLLETRLFTSPLKLFDYMAAKIPIVASNLPSIRAVLTDGETGVLVEPNDPEKLAHAIESVLSDDNLSAKLTSKAYQKAMSFTWEKRAERIVSFLNGVVN